MIFYQTNGLPPRLVPKWHGCGVGDAFCRVRGKSQSRRLAAEAVWNGKPLNLGVLPGCGKRVDILCQQRVDSSRARRVVCTSFEDRQGRTRVFLL